MADSFASTFASVSKADNYSSHFLKIKRNEERKVLNFYCNSPHVYNKDFTFQELLNALNHSHPSSAGPDEVHHHMLVHLTTTSLYNILHLFNRLWKTDFFPDAWRQSIVIPILKPGKDPQCTSSYRPIALTSCLCKWLERMVNARLLSYLESNHLLHPLQSGFRRSRSTLDNILMLETSIREAFVRQHHLVSIFFDIEKAYDHTWRYGILKSLHSFGLRGNLPRFIAKFLKERSFRVRVRSVFSEEFIQEEGVPQGSVLSVTLFIIAIDGLLHQLPPSVLGNLFVDDFQISVSSSNMRLIERQLQTTIKKILAWANNNGFAFSQQKTVCVHFCRKRGIHPDPELFLNNNPITVVPEVKFLGITFDHKLNFLTHIRILKQKCLKTMNILKVLANTSWGADTKSMLRIYKALIRSKLDYGCAIYGSARKSVLQVLDPIHHQGLRLCTGAFRTSPIQSLYVLCHEPSLQIRRHKLSLTYYFKIKSSPFHPAFKKIMFPSHFMLFSNRPFSIPTFGIRMRNILTELHIEDFPVMTFDEEKPPWEDSPFCIINPFNYHPKSHTPDAIFQQTFFEHRQAYENCIAVYTDGSKSTQHVGSAAVIGNLTLQEKIHPESTVFTAEIHAICLALEYISKQSDRNYIIYSDSKSCLDALQNFSHKAHPLVKNCFSLCTLLLDRGFRIVFSWIPGHVGIAGNEAADVAAKTAATPATDNFLALSDIKAAIWSAILSSWQEQWNLEVANKMHSFQPSVNGFKDCLLKNRRQEVIVSRLRLGHTRLTHVHLLFNEMCPTCPYCSSNLSVKHILIECKDLTVFRIMFLTDNFNLSSLLGNHIHPALFSFLKFINFYSCI